MYAGVPKFWTRTAVYMHALEGLARDHKKHNTVSMGPKRRYPPVDRALQAVVVAMKKQIDVCAVLKKSQSKISTTGYLSFGRMAQCVVHALKGLACRASPSRAR